ncbi:MAG TPA: ankyrin repeat domain-containing protein [Sphingomonas sp.]|uniref:ankyrin repeat domain-containing protein n=1 Tax=Sphingomonas sp. TaxID=28214 RepID=UPI002D0F77E4|nr:ankyrin repeat domain-containing protein [Sphingomonas sp.]HMI18936.1 ankyrin repeat domain-containing protein [Sphingomonas sp.]
MGLKSGVSRAMLCGIMLACAVPAAAQFSDSYNFLKAVRDSDGDKAMEFLSKPGAPVLNTRDPATGETALHISVKAHNDNWVGFLLNKGANVEIRDRDGNTALHDAALFADPTAMAYLIALNAKVNATNNRGETPLILAVQRRDLGLARQLIDAGADPKIADTVAGKSAIDYAKDDARGAAMVKLLQEGKTVEKKVVSGPVLN